MKRVEEFEAWEKSKRQEMHFIRTSKDNSAAPIYFLPKEHNDKTMTALEETMDAVENEIKEAKAKFEEDLLKIEAKANNLHQVKTIIIPLLFKAFC